MLDLIDAAAVRAWFSASLSGLARHREEIDAINVFPVADSDTGTNLYLTVEAAVTALAGLPDSDELDRTLRSAARGALLGARGNSGIILSQLFLGAGELLVGAAGVGAGTVAAAIRRGADSAWGAVEHPVEGTVLSVARAAADAAEAAASTATGGLPGDLAAVVLAAAEGARTSLAGSPRQLPVLARAGVVDAGGLGLCVLLDALVEVVTGTRPAWPPVYGPSSFVPSGDDGDGGAEPADAGSDACYEVMYLLEAPAAAVRLLRDRLDSLGDSLVVVGAEGLWSVHVHVRDAGAAVEAALDAGRPRRIRVTHLETGSPRAVHPVRALVAVAVGAGAASLLAEAGVVVVERTSTGVSSADLLDAVTRSAATEVVLLPSEAAAVVVAEAAAASARGAGLAVAVVPARSMVATLAAVAVHDPGRSFSDDVLAMVGAASHVRCGAVTTATTAAVTTAGLCRAGQALGMVDDDVAVVAEDLASAATTVVERLLSGGGELVTLLAGDGDGGAEVAEAVRAHLHRTRPEVDVVVQQAGQLDPPLVVGVE